MAVALDDTARYQPDDAPAVVAAAFACPVCLGGPAGVRLAADPYAPFADCRCGGCATAWRVTLNSFQDLRLRIAPPAALDVVLDRTPADPPRTWRA